MKLPLNLINRRNYQPRQNLNRSSISEGKHSDYLTVSSKHDASKETHLRGRRCGERLL